MWGTMIRLLGSLVHWDSIHWELAVQRLSTVDHLPLSFAHSVAQSLVKNKDAVRLYTLTLANSANSRRHRLWAGSQRSGFLTCPRVL